jgi:hypothetical protein
MSSQLNVSARVRSRNRADLGCADICVRHSKVRGVQRIKCVATNLQHSRPIQDRKRKVLLHADIYVLPSRSEQDTSPRVAKGIRSRTFERCRVEPLVDGRVLLHSRTNAIGKPLPFRLKRATEIRRAHHRREWNARMQLDDAGQQPSSGYFVGQASPVRELLPRTEGKLIRNRPTYNLRQV